jgi:phospholipid transport system substrate-binding protein
MMARLLRGLFHRSVVGALLALAALFAASAGSAAGPASAIVDKLNTEFIRVMQNGPALGYDGRYKELEPVLAASFDFPVMARVASGQHWSDMTPEQQAKLVELFRRYSVAVYAARFKDYSGEKFEILGEEDKPKGTILVQNQIIRSEGEPIRIDYLLRPADGQLRVIDVFLEESISELAVRRSEFSEVLGDKGYDALIATLEQRIVDLAAGKSAE